MYEIIGVFCGLAMVASAFTNDINADTVSNNDFVHIETFEDYGGDVVPYVSDPYIEDNISDDVVEEIIVNQTVVDNSEVLERMDKLDSKLTLLNNSFNSVLSTNNNSLVDLEPLATFKGYISKYNNSFIANNGYYTDIYDLNDFGLASLTITDYYADGFGIAYFDVYPIVNNTQCSLFVADKGSNGSSFSLSSDNSRYFAISHNSFLTYTVKVVSYTPPESDEPIDPPSDPSGNDPSQPSINVTYPQEVIDDVNAMKKQLVTLTGVALLNLIIPMFVSVFKRMVDPFKKRRDD